MQLPAGELPPGWTLLGGQYEIVRLIASGGFGITYLARDTLERDVAVKECFPLGLAQRQAATHVVSATSAGTSEHFDTARAQFLREARMLARLDHPNVVRVQTLFEENGTAYMAMDFIHGRDLQEEIVAQGAPMAPARVLELARDLLGALDYVHNQSVLHRDIKPQNIRIDRFGAPMLIDFGAARAETQARSRMAGTFRVVTDGYSPHEFYVSGAKQGPHSDLYALAATLHHCITGAAPIAADERASALATGQADPYQPIASAYHEQDARLLHLIDRALRMSPGDRPETATAWLEQLADAPTTILATPSAVTETPPQKRGRFVPGLIVGALAMGAMGGGIWASQPGWLMPGMVEMEARMGALEDSLASAEAARAAAEAELGTLQGTLAAAEAELTRLENSDGDMRATMAQLDAARSARDAAATRIAALEADLADLAATQTALTEAGAERDAALARVAELEAESVAAAEQIAALGAELTSALGQIDVLTPQAERLTQVEADLTEAEAALYAANNRATTLEADLAAALEGRQDLTALQAELDALQSALENAEQQRDQLMTQIATAADVPVRDGNAGQVERLRDRVAALEAENATLRDALARAEAALAASGPDETAPPDPRAWIEGAILPAPNGTVALLPRFSWDNQTVALTDSTGGIALYDRETGAYRAHLARGIPEEITRIGFSNGGGYMIATTASGTPDRLFHVPSGREIRRFSPTTVTTAVRAISPDERYFIYTRADASGQTSVVIQSLAEAANANVVPSERILASIPAGQQVRVAFAQTSNDIVVIRPGEVQLYAPDGQLLRSAANRMGQIAAMAPIGRDDGLLILRSSGAVVLFDNAINQRELANIAPRATYTNYRLSGDRRSFFRANATTWEVLDLTTGTIRGSGPVGQGYGDADISISPDGAMIFIGAIDGRPARLLNVDTGAEIQQFGAADEGYFSFDNLFLATGAEGDPSAQIWRLNQATD
ncbi:protein kinase [Gymnodinialimonas sp. 2305UL16-5]